MQEAPSKHEASVQLLVQPAISMLRSENELPLMSPVQSEEEELKSPFQSATKKRTSSRGGVATEKTEPLVAAPSPSLYGTARDLNPLATQEYDHSNQVRTDNSAPGQPTRSSNKVSVRSVSSLGQQRSQIL